MRRIFVFASAILLAMALSLVFASSALGRTNEQLIRDTKVNGLCGKGIRTCMWWTIDPRHRVYAGNGWHIYEVRYYETLGFAGPWSVRRCYVSRVSARWGQSIGTPVAPDYCAK